MGWRTIYIQDASKLSLNLDNLEVKNNGTKYFIALEEIDNIVVEDYKTVITARLLSKLCEVGISVVFTTPNKMPVGSLHALTCNSRTSKYTKEQLKLSIKNGKLFWSEIVTTKISSQGDVLERLGKNSEIIRRYETEVLPGDKANREGLAARAYFREMFGRDFIRFEDDIINYSLNYIYQIMRSKIAQSIVAKGFHPSFGLFHRNEYNYFNLADDLIEPYRPLCDYYIYKLLEDGKTKFLTPEYKEKIYGIYYMKIELGGKKMKLIDSIDVYMHSIFGVYSTLKFEDIKYPYLLDE